MLDWMPNHLRQPANAFQTILSKIEILCSNLRKSMLLVQRPTLFRTLEIAWKISLLRLLDALPNEQAACTSSSMLGGGDELGENCKEV